MPKVKLVLMTESYDYDYDDYYTSHILRSGITDWDEISNEEYDLLMKNKGYMLNKAAKVPDGSSIVVLKQDEEAVFTRIDSLTKLIKKMEEDRIKEEQERIAKKEAEALKRKLRKEAKTVKDELALLAALKEKHEGK